MARFLPGLLVTLSSLALFHLIFQTAGGEKVMECQDSFQTDVSAKVDSSTREPPRVLPAAHYSQVSSSLPMDSLQPALAIASQQPLRRTPPVEQALPEQVASTNAVPVSIQRTNIQPRIRQPVSPPSQAIGQQRSVLRSVTTVAQPRQVAPLPPVPSASGVFQPAVGAPSPVVTYSPPTGVQSPPTGVQSPQMVQRQPAATAQPTYSYPQTAAASSSLVYPQPPAVQLPTSGYSQSPVVQPHIAQSPVVQPQVVQPQVVQPQVAQPPVMPSPVAQPVGTQIVGTQIMGTQAVGAPMVVAPSSIVPSSIVYPTASISAQQPSAAAAPTPAVVGNTNPAYLHPANVTTRFPAPLVSQPTAVASPPVAVVAQQPALSHAVPQATEAARQNAPSVSRPSTPSVPNRPPPNAMDWVNQPSLRAVASQCDAAVERAFALARKGAIYSARGEVMRVLSSAVQTIDAYSQSSYYSQMLQEGLLALKEADDFYRASRSGSSAVDARALAAGHRTPALKGHDTSRITPMVAMQSYYSFAQDRLARAGAGAPVVSRLLFALGRIHTAMSELETTEPVAHGPRSIAFHQAALTVDSRNHQAANELGVLLARFGQLQHARSVLQYSVALQPTTETWHNLAVVHQRLGELDLAHRANYEMSYARPMPGITSTPLVQWVDPRAFGASWQAGVPIPNPASTSSPMPQAPPRTAQGPRGVWQW